MALDDGDLRYLDAKFSGHDEIVRGVHRHLRRVDDANQTDHAEIKADNIRQWGSLGKHERRISTLEGRHEETDKRSLRRRRNGKAHWSGLVVDHPKATGAVAIAGTIAAAVLKYLGVV